MPPEGRVVERTYWRRNPCLTVSQPFTKSEESHASADAKHADETMVMELEGEASVAAEVEAAAAAAEEEEAGVELELEVGVMLRRR